MSSSLTQIYSFIKDQLIRIITCTEVIILNDLDHFDYEGIIYMEKEVTSGDQLRIKALANPFPPLGK